MEAKFYCQHAIADSKYWQYSHIDLVFYSTFVRIWCQEIFHCCNATSYIQSTQMHACQFNGHFPGEPGLVRCPVNFLCLLVPNLLILLEHSKTSRAL